jgi:hypothetical protein
VSGVPGTAGHTPGGSEPHEETPASRLGGGQSKRDASAMFNDLLEMTAVEVRVHLAQLEAERALAVSTGVADIDAYMADLEVEIEATRELYVASAVTEIATLRAELSGAQVG